MISHNLNCIFIHIPKCAGTSIEKALGHFNEYYGRNGQDHRSIRMIEQPCYDTECVFNLSNFKELLRRFRHKFIKNTNPKNHLTVSPRQYAKYFKFSIVRNPYDRAYSWYRNIIRDDFHLRYYGMSKDIEFSEYLKNFLQNNYMMRQQLDWLRNFKGDIKLDYIGKFENLNTVFETISKHLPLKKIKLPHEKKTEYIDYRQAYDSKSIDLVTKFYKDDLKFFDYKFD